MRKQLITIYKVVPLYFSMVHEENSQWKQKM